MSDIDMGCGCIGRMNDALVDDNTLIDTAIWMNLETMQQRLTVRVGVMKRDTKNRKRPLPIVPTFCPFCGARYQTEATA